MALETLPPLNAIRAFEAAARLGSFAKAAAELHVTHWAIGKQVRLLEDWMGMPLFWRRSRGIDLTEEGAEAKDVASVFSNLSTATKKLRHAEGTYRLSGIVRVNVPTSFALRWLIPRLSEFRHQFPNITVRISTTSRKFRYIGSAFDLGIRLMPDPTSVGTLAALDFCFTSSPLAGGCQRFSFFLSQTEWRTPGSFRWPSLELLH